MAEGTQVIQIGAQGGICMADSAADPATHASIDVNGDFSGEYRAVRKGPRAVYQLGGPNSLSMRGLYAFKTPDGFTRLLVAAEATGGTTVQIRTSYGGYTQTVWPGELVFLLIDPTYYDLAALTVNPVTRPTTPLFATADFRPVIGLCVSAMSTNPLTPAPRPVADATARPGGDWQAQFYKQGDTLVCFGHPMGAWKLSMAKLSAPVVSDAFSFGIAEGHVRYEEFLLEPGYYTAEYTYFEGSVPQCRAYDIGGTAWYVPLAEASMGVTTPVADLQDAIPEAFIDAGRLSMQWSPRLAYSSEEATAEHVKPMFSWIAAPTDRRIMAVMRMGQSIDFILDRGSLLLDWTSLGGQSRAWLVAGTMAPGSVQEIGNSVVFVSRDGIVRHSDQGEVCVSSPHLDAFFRGQSRSTLPAPLGATEAAHGLPFRLDHERMKYAQSYVDLAKKWYVVALTTTCSTVPNDLLLFWDYGRADERNPNGRFWFWRQNDLYDDGAAQWRFKYDSTTFNQITAIPALSCFGLAAIENEDGSTSAYCCNSLGVWALGEEGFDTVQLYDQALSIIAQDQEKDIESFRVTPVIGAGGTDPVAVQKVAYTLYRNAFRDNGVVQVYAEGERGSTQIKDVSELSSPNPFRETGRMTGVLIDRSDRAVPFWGATGATWGGGAVYAREDYITIQSEVPLRGVPWFRLTFYDRRGLNVLPVLALASARAGVDAQ